jgi:CBS domain-containing protein
MGEQNVKQYSDETSQQQFMGSLLSELQAMEYMLANDMFETGIRRIGAEQEMFLVDKARKPGLLALKMLDHIEDERFTHELGLFNVEANLSPYVLGGNCLSAMESEGQELYKIAREAAAKVGGDIALVGILPTLSKKYLGLDSMVPTPRYHALNNAVVKLRGKEFQFSIEGIDQLNVIHDNVMLEACNTSFQVHFQVEPDEFARLYNIAQVVTGPLLAASVNSPLLLGKRLWHETRIAVFEHSVDARSDAHQERGLKPRVHFGDHWIKDSVIEIFKEDIARFRVILTTDTEEDPMGMLERGQIPKLRALTLHNGTVYRWNRACYGVAENVAHLRIENRVIPSGPTVLDEIANASFFIGMMSGMAAKKECVSDQMLFEYARTNFISAARDGLKAQQLWFDERQVPAQELIINELLPLAYDGLKISGVDKVDAERYLGVIEQRVRSRRTGARWALESLAGMGDEGTLDERLRSLTTSMIQQQQNGIPVHEWEEAEMCPTQDWRDSYRTVGQFMATDLFTVRPDDIVDFAASIMDWRHIRHVPVEDDEGNLVGLVSHRSLLRLVARGFPESPAKMTVREIMNAEPEVLTPETTTVEAIRTMREKKVACMPVTENGRLVGIVTDYDLIVVSSRLLEEYLSEDA